MAECSQNVKRALRLLLNPSSESTIPADFRPEHYECFCSGEPSDQVLEVWTMWGAGDSATPAAVPPTTSTALAPLGGVASPPLSSDSHALEADGASPTSSSTALALTPDSAAATAHTQQKTAAALTAERLRKFVAHVVRIGREASSAASTGFVVVSPTHVLSVIQLAVHSCMRDYQLLHRGSPVDERHATTLDKAQVEVVICIGKVLLRQLKVRCS